MDFKVYTNTHSEGSSDEYSGDDSGYSVQDAGVLLAWDETRRVTYSPTGWLRLEEPRDQGHDLLDTVH
jgi:hypothetical protein